jgi:hypothetical protein
VEIIKSLLTQTRTHYFITRFFFISLIIVISYFPLLNAIDDENVSKPTSYTADGRPIYTVPRIDSKIQIDGVINEESWNNALVLELKYEVRPGENIPPPVRTEVLLAYDETNLYIAFRAYDPNPSEIRAHLQDRDNLGGDDWVAVMLDTFNDERRCFDFAATALGVQCDLIETATNEDISWDAIWDSAGRINDWGYAVEMAIPFTSLRFQRTDGPQIWSFDASRRYPRSKPHHIGLFPRDRSNNCYLCQAVKISGFEHATPGHNLEVSPTVYAVRTDERTDFPEGDFQVRDQKAEAGLTAHWGMTPNLTLSATVNPDFSQVEADSLQLDINEPFALFYPERRPFFTEGTDFFAHPMLDIVYTRTMRDPSFGLKLSGKERMNTIGAYIIRDEYTNLIFPGSQSSNSTSLRMKSTASVFRYKRDVGNKYTFGVFFTDREGGDYFNRVLEFDSDLRLTDTDRIKLQVIGSSTRYPDDIAAEFDQQQGSFNDKAISFEYDHNTRTVGWWADYEESGAGFRADLGFIPKVGYRKVEGEVNYNWNPRPGNWWHNLWLGSEFNLYNDLDGNLLYRAASLKFEYRGPLQSYAYIRYRRSREAFNGMEFDQNYLYLVSSFYPNGNCYVGTQVLLGDRIDYANTRLGKRLQISPDITYKLGLHLNLSLGHTYERLNVEGERLYTANISRISAVYQFNTRTFFRSILQYIDYRYNVELYNNPIDPKYQHLTSQLLFSYKINPRTVLFIGYSDNHYGAQYGAQDLGIIQANRTFFIKLGYAWVL